MLLRDRGTSSSITPSAHRYHRFTLDRLLHLPNVEPPQPVDWDVRPTHPVHNVPYQLAHYWDKKGGVRELVEERKTKTTGLPSTGKVPRELHAKAKRTPAVKSWLRVLEEPVRQFLVDRGVAGREESDSSSLDSEDEEIVFVGRNGSMHDARSWKKARREKKDAEPQQGMVLDSLGDDESAAFKYVCPLSFVLFGSGCVCDAGAYSWFVSLGDGSPTPYPITMGSTRGLCRWVLRPRRLCMSASSRCRPVTDCRLGESSHGRCGRCFDL